MTSPRLNLVVIRSVEPSRTVSFYELLGIGFQEERHGSGVLHWAADIGGLVLEVYPAKAADEAGKNARLGFEVEDVAAILKTLEASGIEITSDLKKSPWGLRAVVRDPDGRSIELVQR